MDNYRNTLLGRHFTHSLCIKIIALSIVHCALSISNCFAQSDTSVRVIEAPGVNRTMQKRLEYARRSNGVFPGYRIQVGFGQDRNEATKLRSDVALKYPNLPNYLNYQQPYFKICVGDFRTKLEAVKNLNIIKKDYPGAFMVKEKINPPPLAN